MIKKTWKYSEDDREKLRQMVANGMNRRTAYRKLAKVCKRWKHPHSITMRTRRKANGFEMERKMKKCGFCKDIGTDEKAILTHELDVGDGNSCEYGVYVYRQDGKVYLSLCDAENGETAYTEIHNCPMCGRDFKEA